MECQQKWMSLPAQAAAVAASNVHTCEKIPQPLFHWKEIYEVRRTWVKYVYLLWAIGQSSLT